jgi:hypothetical protein
MSGAIRVTMKQPPKQQVAVYPFQAGQLIEMGQKVHEGTQRDEGQDEVFSVQIEVGHVGLPQANQSLKILPHQFATADRQHVFGDVEAVDFEAGLGQRDQNPARAASQFQDW